MMTSPGWSHPKLQLRQWADLAVQFLMDSQPPHGPVEQGIKIVVNALFSMFVAGMLLDCEEDQSQLFINGPLLLSSTRF